jgi:hypothetical protein
MADDLLGRILQEVRDRKEAARAAHEESRRLEAALEALGPRTGRVSRPQDAGQSEDMPESTGPGPQDLGTAAPAEDTPDLGGEDPGRTAEESSGPTEGTPEDLKPGAAPGADDDGADAGESAEETSP